MNKYLKYYYIDTAIIIITVILMYCLHLDQMDYYGMFDSGVFFPVAAVLFAVSIIMFLLNIVLLLGKYKFEEKSILFPKYFLIFYVFIVILGILYNQFVFIKNMHVMYYFTFIILGYAMLSIYTAASFKKEKKIRKKNK